MAARQLKIVLRALRLLLRYRLRSSLLMLMAALGVSGVVCSVNYGAGGTRQLLDQIRRMGTNVLIITPAESRAVAGRARTGGTVTTLVERDYAIMRKVVLTRTRSSGIVSASFRIKAGDLSKNVPVVGVEPDYFAIKSWSLIVGEHFDADQERSSARVAVLGYTVAVDLFGSAPAVGQHVMINRVPFMVEGILAERGQGLDVGNEDNQVYVPLTTAMRRLLNTDHYSGMVIEVDPATSMNDAAVEIRSLLRNAHRIPRGRADDFQIQNQKMVLDTQMTAAARLNFFLRWIAASALTVSGMGIVALTWSALKERTREIGTCRALGATRNDIFVQVLFETVTLAVGGSLLGLALSWPASRFISDSVGLPLVFEESTAMLALAAAIALNLVFAILPSRKAASISPLQALRYE